MGSMKNTFRFRVLSLFLCAVMLIGILPLNVFTAVASTNSEFGVLSCLTEGGSLENEANSKAIATFGSLTLQWENSDPDIGRTEAGWWVGVKMTAPNGMTEQADFVSEDKSVTYQSKGSNGEWSGVKSFWDAQDSDPKIAETERYLTMWGLVNEEKLNEAILSGTNITYQWKFDWNKDGAYEQTATLEIDPSEITLKKSDETVYPTESKYIGTVKNPSEGFSVANENSNVVTVSCNAEDIQLAWVAQNEGGIKRPTDGWWVGFRVVAPNGYKGQLEKAQFQTKSGSDETWSGENLFNKFKDSEDGAEEQYVGLWSLVNPDILKNAEATVDYSFRFDWDGDGVYEQIILLEIEPEKMILTDQDGVQAYPALGAVTPLCGGEVAKTDGKFVVSNEKETVQITAAERDDVAGRKQDGWWAGVKVEKPEWANAETAKFQVQVDGAYPDSIADKGNSFAQYADDERKTYISLWAFLGDDVAAIKAKEIIVAGWRFDWDGDGNYEQVIELHVDTSKNLVLNTIDQSMPLAFNTPTPFIKGTSDESNLSYTNPAQGGSGDGEVTYAVDADGSAVQIDKNAGIVTFAKDVEGEFTVTATKAAKGIYKEQSATYTLYAVKSSYAVTYGENGNKFANPIPEEYTKPFEGITYSAISQSPLVDTEETVAEVNSSTGEVTVNRAGTVKIQAEWKGQTFEYTLTVNRADAEYTANAQAKYGDVTGRNTELASSITVDEKYGITVLEHTLTPPEDADDNDFTVSVGENQIGATVNGTTVKIADSETKTGSVTVTMHREADSRYNAIDLTYTLAIGYDNSFPEFDQKTWLDGEKKNDSEWYMDDVTIKAPEGYTISSSDSLSDNAWGDSVKVSYEGENKTTVYVKDKTTGHISGAIDCGTIKIDKNAPAAEDMTIEFSELTLVQKIGSTLGFYNPNITIIFTAKDYTSGIDHFDWTYTREENVSTLNKEEAKGEIAVTQVDGTSDTWTATLTLPEDEAEQLRGKISFTATDVAGNESDHKAEDYVFVVDTISPTVKVEYSAYSCKDDEGQTFYGKTVEGDQTAGEVTVTFTVNEANFDKDDVKVTLTKFSNIKDKTGTDTDISAEVEWTDESTDIHTGRYTITGEGHYIVSFWYHDKSYQEGAEKNGTVTTYSTPEKITIDTTDPTIAVKYDPDEATANGKFFNCARKATVTVTEHNFRPEDIEAAVEAKDANGASIADEQQVAKEIADHLKNPNNWTSEGDTHTATVPFTVNAQYSKFTIDYKDQAGNQAKQYSAPAFVIDQELPSEPSIEYREHINFWDVIANAVTLGYYTYNPSVTVTVTSSDEISGIDYFDWTYTKQKDESGINVDKESGRLNVEITEDQSDKKTATKSFTLTADEAKQYRGHISVTAYDRSTNHSEKSDDARINIVDTISPKINVTYSSDEAIVKYTDADLHDVDDFAAASKAFFNKAVTATISIDEANFFEGVTAKDGVIHEVGILLTKTASEGHVTKTEYLPEGAAQKYAGEGAVPQTFSWDSEGDIHTFEIAYSDDADYVLTVEYVDFSKNEAVITANDGNTATKKYESKTITVDKTDPVISAVYAPADAVANEKFFNTDREMTVTIVDHSFRAEDLEVTVSAKDANGVSIASEEQVVKEISDYLTDRTHWTNTGDTHVATVPFTVDAQYEVTIDYSDLVGNVAKQYVALPFVVDHVAPSNLTISYSQEVKFWQKVLNAITFGYYSYNNNEETNKPFVATVTAFDDISGVDFFTWTYTREAGSSDSSVETVTKVISSDKISRSDGQKTATATFRLDGTEAEQYRGTILFTATDRAANESGKQGDSSRINIVDTISPTREVTYSDAKQVVDAATLQTKSTYAYSGENTNSILYYDDDVTVTVKITEANFYAEDVVIKDNDTVISPNNWTQNGDEWTATFTLVDEGDHIVTMQYTDRSNNAMTDYQSQRIIIDRTKPVIDVAYRNSDVKNTVRDNDGHDRQYLDKEQTATITITEHNFRPDDVIIKVKAKNVVGSNVFSNCDADGNVNLYAAEGRSREEWAELTPYTDTATWRRDGDTFRLVIDYTNDANYTFDIEYKDLAGNAAADYSSDYFTVDKTAPKNLGVAYSTNVFENVLESVTFGYYNAQMTVTLTAEDDTSGIYHFLYSYVKSEGVSDVNAELIDDAISSAAISYDGAKATAEFKIPKYVLANDNQFNGTVRFTAYDCAENSTAKTDNHRIVVDNISPKADVTYNAPVQNVNNVSYYAGDVNATVTMREANFYPEDARINITRDGVSVPVNVNWIHNSVDEHVGTFTLHEDGDYIVTINYADRSTNAMEEYVSNQLTIDTKVPVISVSNLKHQSANNEEAIGFTISVSDINIPIENFKPVLNAVVKKDNGDNNFAYETTAIALGNPSTTSVNGETVHSYTVSNLDTDGYYSLSCTAVDYANHSVSVINAAADEGGNAAVETMNFSVNREGSVFWIETEHNDKYTNETFTDKLDGAYANDNVVIKLHEVNVDKVDENADKRTVFTLNDGSKSEDIVLQENENYSKNVIVGTGGWYETIYTLNNNTFDHDGVYSLNVITYDKAGNNNVNTKTDAGTISFTLDRTNPVISANVKTNQSIRDTQFWVEFEISETNLAAETIVVKLTNNDGKAVETNVEDLGNNGYRFLVESGYNYSFEIAAKDLAGNESEIYKVEHFTVSTNIFILWYANTPLFWGSIGGTVLLAGLIILLIFLKKRKKNEEK